MKVSDYIKPSYTFKEVYELQKLPLSVKIEISVEVLRRAFELSTHNIALAFKRKKLPEGSENKYIHQNNTTDKEKCQYEHTY